MKNCYLIILFIMLQLGGLSQSYLNSSSIWYFNGNSFDMISYSYTYNRYYYFDGDSTLNGLSYYKLFLDRYDTLFNFNTEETTAQTELHTAIGLLREENGKFYKRSMGATADTLTFDFNSYELGTVLTNGEAFCPGEFVITSIDTVYLGGEARKRYFFNDMNMHFVVEGVGGGSGGFELGCPGLLAIEGTVYPACYSMDGNSVSLGFGTVTDCVFDVADDIITRENPALEVFPNPTTGLCRIQHISPNAKIRIIDMHGREHPFMPDNGSIDITSLPAGVYLMQVVSETGIVSERILKM